MSPAGIAYTVAAVLATWAVGLVAWVAITYHTTEDDR